MTAVATGPLPEYRIESVSAPAMHQMAVILDDPNQIHLDPDAVRAAGLGDRVINQGPTNVGYAMDMLRAAFPGARVRRFSAKFLQNVFGGDTVVIRGTVDSVEDHGDHITATCTVEVQAEPARPVLAATAIVDVPA